VPTTTNTTANNLSNLALYAKISDLQKKLMIAQAGLAQLNYQLNQAVQAPPAPLTSGYSWPQPTVQISPPAPQPGVYQLTGQPNIVSNITVTSPYIPYTDEFMTLDSNPVWEAWNAQTTEAARIGFYLTCMFGGTPGAILSAGMSAATGDYLGAAFSLPLVALPVAKIFNMGANGSKAFVPVPPGKPPAGLFPPASSQYQPPSLVHLTNEAGFQGIQTTQTINGANGIFAIPAQTAVTQSGTSLSWSTMLPIANTTHAIPIPANATHLFSRPIPVGPFSAWHYVGGTHFARPGSLNLVTGTLTPRPGAWRPYLVMYGPDAAVYGSVGGAIYSSSRR
jgi:hypothetical protein